MNHLRRTGLIALPAIVVVVGWLLWPKTATLESRAAAPAVTTTAVTSLLIQPASTLPTTTPAQESCNCASSSNAPSEAELKELKAKAELANAWIPLEKESFDAFLAMSADRQLEYVTAYRNNSNLSDSAIAFLKRAILEKRLGVTTRNAVANVLVSNFDRFPQQQTFYEKMVNDIGESAVWREYALQHFAQLAFSSQQPEIIRRVLMDVARSGSSDMAATAMIQLSFLEHRGIMTLPSDYADELAKRLADTKGSLASKMSMVGLIGSRRMNAHLDTVRRLTSSDQPSLRRVALATLGLIGDASDAEHLKMAIADRDPSVSIAARDAYERLAEQSAAH